MTSGQKGRAGGRNRKAAKRIPLAAHRAYAPLLGLWGALLGGLVVLVLPASLVETSLSRTLISTWDINPQPYLALVAAILLGVPMFAIGAYRHGRTRRQKQVLSAMKKATRQVTPINPVRDLGSQRLDDPIEAMPFTTEAWRDADLVELPCEAAAAPAAASEPVAETMAEPAEETAPPELDLAQFAELPGRNAVWVEEAACEPAPEPEPEPEPVAPAPLVDPVADIRTRRLRAVASIPPAPGGAALARLRETPASELSLAEMVERFAAALQEHRETPPHLRPGGPDLAAREAALAEALKALAALSEDRPPAPRLPQRDDPLRAALAQLQPQAERSRPAA